MTEKSFIRADEVAEELDVSKSYAYKAVSYTHLDVYKRQPIPCGVYCVQAISFSSAPAFNRCCMYCAACWINPS